MIASCNKECTKQKVITEIGKEWRCHAQKKHKPLSEPGLMKRRSLLRFRPQSSPMKGKPPRSASFVVLLTLLMSAPRRVICVCLQPWPPFLPHRAAPWAPCFLRNTWSVLECSPVTLCLNDRHRFPECMRWPRGSTKRAAFPPGPLVAETVRYCPPARGKAGLCMCRHPFPAQTVWTGVLPFFSFCFVLINFQL